MRSYMNYSKDLLEKVAKIIIPHLKTKHKKMQAEEMAEEILEEIDKDIHKQI